MVVPSQGPVYILLKDTVGLKRPPRRIGVRIGSQKLFTAKAGSIYLSNKDDRQPEDKTMISLVLLSDPNCILVAPKEQTRLLNTAELNVLLPIVSEESRAKTVLNIDFTDLVKAQVNDIVQIKDGKVYAEAKVKYVGQLSWTKSNGIYLGVEFEEPIGDNDGCSLFETKAKHAKFITADKVEKFVYKTERVHYASDSVILRSNPNNASKIYKRLSMPIAATFAKLGKHRMKSSRSVEDLSSDVDKSSIDNQGDSSINKDEEIHYAVSEVVASDNNNVKNKKKSTQILKRKSFPTLSFSKINFTRKRSKSLQDLPTVESTQTTENPYYTQSSITEEVDDNITQTEDTLVLCYNDGCDERMEKNELEKHEKMCRFAFVKCPNEGCGLLIRRNEINKHDIMECKYAIVRCPNDKCDVQVIRKLMTQHQAKCDKDNAELACDASESYESMEPAIFENECPAPGCTFKGFGNEVCNHLCEKHCELLIKNLSKLKVLFHDSPTFDDDFSDLYSKPNKEKSTEDLQIENPLYSASCVGSKSESENVYLSPCDSFLSHDDDVNETVSEDDVNIYLQPVDTPPKKDENTEEGEHIYSTPMIVKGHTPSPPQQKKYQYMCPEFEI